MTRVPGWVQVAQASEAAEKVDYFVILSEAKNPSAALSQKNERFLGTQRASERQKLSFSVACSACGAWLGQRAMMLQPNRIG